MSFSDWSYQPWSRTGHRKLPQPDDAEFFINQVHESCLAILNNMYNDSVAFHDVACHHKTRFICEDSEPLLEQAKMIELEQQEKLKDGTVETNLKPDDKIEKTTTAETIKITTRKAVGEKKNVVSRRRNNLRKSLEKEAEEEKVTEPEEKVVKVEEEETTTEGITTIS